MDCSPPGSSVHEILQARILEWVAIPFSRGSSQPRDQTQVSCIAGRFFTIWPPGKPICNGLVISPKKIHEWLISTWKPIQRHSVQFSCSAVSDSLQPHELQHARPPCPTPTPGAHSCPLSRWCHPTISSSVVPFFSFPHSFPPSGSLQRH